MAASAPQKQFIMLEKAGTVVSKKPAGAGFQARIKRGRVSQ